MKFDLEDKELHNQAVKAAEQGRRFVSVPVLGEEIQFDVDQILTCAGDIHGQIYARDFKFIEQSDMIISYIPCDENGRPILSSGVERELQQHYAARPAVGANGVMIPNASGQLCLTFITFWSHLIASIISLSSRIRPITFLSCSVFSPLWKRSLLQERGWG